jgi:hypothetical protein
MKKTPPTRVNNVTQDYLPDVSTVRGDSPDRAEKPAFSTLLHSQFNPSRVGFGIPGKARGIRHQDSRIHEQITSEIKVEEGQ